MLKMLKAVEYNNCNPYLIWRPDYVNIRNSIYIHINPFHPTQIHPAYSGVVLQHRQVNLNARKIHVLFLTDGNIIHHLNKPTRIKMRKLSDALAEISHSKVRPLWQHDHFRSFSPSRKGNHQLPEWCYLQSHWKLVAFTFTMVSKFQIEVLSETETNKEEQKKTGRTGIWLGKRDLT